MNMIERVARAMADVNEKTVGLTFRELNREMARAAIEALREPTDAMVNEAIEAAGMESWDHIEERMGQAYRAAIDAALTQESE